MAKPRPLLLSAWRSPSGKGTHSLTPQDREATELCRASAPPPLRGIPGSGAQRLLRGAGPRGSPSPAHPPAPSPTRRSPCLPRPHGGSWASVHAATGLGHSPGLGRTQSTAARMDGRAREKDGVGGAFAQPTGAPDWATHTTRRGLPSAPEDGSSG